MKKTYEMNGKTYATLSAIAKELGIARIRSNQLDKYGIKEVNSDDMKKVDDAVVTNDVPVTVDTTADKADKKASAPAKKVKSTKKSDETKAELVITTIKTGTAEDIAEVEKNVVDMNAYELGKAVTNFTLDALVTMVKNVDGNTWDSIKNAPIRKMRLIMELKKQYFPDEVRQSAPAKVSPWKAITTEVLKKVAKKQKVSWIECNNDSINRMRIIMALKKKGVQAEDLNK
jgi:hypothetical protein